MRAVESEFHNVWAADINKHSFGSVHYLLGCKTRLQHQKWSSYQPGLKPLVLILCGMHIPVIITSSLEVLNNKFSIG